VGGGRWETWNENVRTFVSTSQYFFVRLSIHVERAPHLSTPISSRAIPLTMVTSPVSCIPCSWRLRRSSPAVMFTGRHFRLEPIHRLIFLTVSI
jgi:hypothetical protein